MKETDIFDAEYRNWLTHLKSTIRSVQVKAAMAVNTALIEFYWELGKMITEKQTETQWGDKLIDRVAKDLKEEFPEMKGLSRTNLFYAKNFYLFYQPLIVQQPVGQLGQQPVDQFGQQTVAQFLQQPVAEIAAAVA